MKLQTFQFRADTGWSIQTFPNLDSDKTLIFVFAAPEFIDHSEPLLELAKQYPKSKIIGCSSAGEILGPSISDNSISVAVVKFEKTPIRISSESVHSTDDSYQAGKAIADDLNDDELRGIFVLSDGLQINGSELVRGLNSINRDNVIITGGLAGDGSRFKQTWVIVNNEIVSGKIVAVGFYGDYVQIGHGSRGGWDIFGPERRVTRAKNNILYELDGEPALALYKKYLGEKAAGLPATGLLFPLAIRKDENDKKQLVRTILGINEKDQSLTFAGDIPVGYRAQLMRANFDRLITGANEAGKQLLANNYIRDHQSPTLLVAISCVGRRLLLGERTEEETESVLEYFSDNTQQVGFYSYGELSPHTKGSCELHNQTMTLTTISEEL